MRIKTLDDFLQPGRSSSRPGFTLIELLIGSVVILVVVLTTLSLYSRSNKVSVDQQQFTELQHDVRSAMFFIQRDVRSGGVGLIEELAGHFIEGTDGHGPAPISPDALKIMGNLEDPLSLEIDDYSEGVGGGAASVHLVDDELDSSPYACPDYYWNKTVLIVSTDPACAGCFAFRFVDSGAQAVHGCGGGEEHINFTHGHAPELNPPGGLVEPGCPGSCWDDAFITFINVKQYWLDTTGNPNDYPADLDLHVGQDGYLGVANVLYLTSVGENGMMSHFPLAQNIENLQFQYNGDLNDDGTLDGFADWDNTWALNDISKIRQVRMWVLGRTPNPFVSVSGTPPPDLYLYRRPCIANSTTNCGANAQDDGHRRFLLESTVNIRNLSLSIYNTGTR